jgi:hypothetical protein
LSGQNYWEARGEVLILESTVEIGCSGKHELQQNNGLLSGLVANYTVQKAHIIKFCN